MPCGPTAPGLTAVAGVQGHDDDAVGLVGPARFGRWGPVFGLMGRVWCCGHHGRLGAGPGRSACWGRSGRPADPSWLAAGEDGGRRRAMANCRGSWRSGVRRRSAIRASAVHRLAGTGPTPAVLVRRHRRQGEHLGHGLLQVDHQRTTLGAVLAHGWRRCSGHRACTLTASSERSSGLRSLDVHRQAQGGTWKKKTAQPPRAI